METDVVSRCPSCSASLRPDAQWCSLCHHDLRPAAPAPLVPAPSQPVYAGHDPLTAPLLDLVLPPVPPAAQPVAPAAAVPAPAPVPVAEGEATWPCTACNSQNPFSLTVCGHCGTRFLQAASEPPSLVVPGIGDLQQLSRGHRAAVAAGFVALIVVPLALITFFLTHEPKQAPGSNSDVTITQVAP